MMLVWACLRFLLSERVLILSLGDPLALCVRYNSILLVARKRISNKSGSEKQSGKKHLYLVISFGPSVVLY